MYRNLYTVIRDILLQETSFITFSLNVRKNYIQGSKGITKDPNIMLHSVASRFIVSSCRV